MRMPTDWSVGQLVTDFYLTLSEATQRELDSLPNNIDLSDELRSELLEVWEHYHSAAFLMTSFAVVEAALGPQAWRDHLSLPQLYALNLQGWPNPHRESIMAARRRCADEARDR